MLKKIEGNTFTNTKDEKRFLFSLDLKDMEQKDSSEIILEIDALKRELNLLGGGDLLKIYYLDNRAYLDNSQNNNPLSYFKSTPLKGDLTPFINKENVYSDPLFKDDYCKLNSIYFRFISISLKDDHQIDVADFQKHGDFLIKFKKINTVFSKALVNDARKMGHSALYNLVSDIEGIEAYKENEEMLRKIITREEELFKTEVLFLVRSKTENELLEKTNNNIESLDIAGLSPRIETVSINNAFKNFIPGIFPRFQSSLLFHTSLLANALPLHSDSLMREGVPFHSRSKTELKLNLNEGNSYSMLVTGVTGNGKTFFVQKVLDHNHSRGRKVLILDPKKDYRKFAMLKNSYVIDESINPMMFKDPIFLRNMILSKVPKTERTALWEGRLLRAIRETNAFECTNFFKALEKIKIKGFKDIEFYFEDIIDKISEKKVELSDFTYIEFDSFTRETIPFLLSFAFEYTRKLKSSYDLVIDEAHRIFKHDPTFLEERVREMRVQNASLIPITQKFKDLTSTTFGEVIADNCYHNVFFAQNIECSKGITLFDQQMIHSLRTNRGEYSEFYYKSEVHRKVLRYFPTLREFEVFKSGNEESEKMLSYIDSKLKYFTVDEAVNQWVRDRYAL